MMGFIPDETSHLLSALGHPVGKHSGMRTRMQQILTKAASSIYIKFRSRVKTASSGSMEPTEHAHAKIAALNVTKALKGREKEKNFKRMKTSTIITTEKAEMQGHQADREIERVSRQQEREIVQQPIAEALMHNPELEGLNKPYSPVGG